MWQEHKPAWVEAPRTQALTPEEFVALSLAEPIGTESAQYGYCLRAASGNDKAPGVIALTWISAKTALPPAACLLVGRPLPRPHSADPVSALRTFIRIDSRKEQK